MKKIADYFMKLRLRRNSRRGTGVNAGFSALIAILLVSSGILAFCAVVMDSAYSYYESVNKKEIRYQLHLNTQSCLAAATLMLAKDYFMATTTIEALGCTVSVRQFGGNRVLLHVETKLQEQIETDQYSFIQTSRELIKI